MICIAHQYFSGDQIKNNKMGEACSLHGERIDAYRVLVWKRDHLEDRGVDGAVILKNGLQEVVWGRGLD
jgi:hypothetical protein